ncbi:putative transcriptional regulatory protein [Toxocara canis]|uniref:Putative transcriptional regulatory protein n=1 Tax=Toxocara canis TaxID=6265 RepID=A0A0B2VYT9_TOXCA|nr:putative transcriptional regulatory protein [Toxocara canis]
MTTFVRFFLPQRRNLSLSVELLKGHSKWQNIKATKGKMDMLKSQTTNMLLRKVKSAVQRGGFDLKLNKELAALQQQFRSEGLSLDSFNNFLLRLKVQLKDKPESTYYFDVIGPSGSFFIIEVETDSKTRMHQTIAKYMNKVGSGFRFATDTGIRRRFEEKGVIQVSAAKAGVALPLDEMEEVGIELDCEDVEVVEGADGGYFELICDLKRLQNVEQKLTARGYDVVSAEVRMRALHTVVINEDDSAKVEKFYGFLQEDDSIKQIFDNIEPEAQAVKATAS